MSGVKLINETDQDIFLYEGTGGVFRSLKTISKGKEHVLKVDPNETYREYRCKLHSKISPKSQAVVLTPFVFAEYTQITIKWDRTRDTLSYETMKKESGSNAAADRPSGQASPGLVQRLLSNFSWKKELAQSDGGVGDGGVGDGGVGDGGGGRAGASGAGVGGGGKDVPERGGAPDTWRLMLSSDV